MWNVNRLEGSALASFVAILALAACGDSGSSATGGGGEASGGSANGGSTTDGGGNEGGNGGEAGQGGIGQGGMGGEGAQGGMGQGGMGGEGGAPPPDPNCTPVENGEIAEECGLFVNAAVAAGGRGSKLAPFNNLTEAAAAARPGTRIYVCLEPLTQPETVTTDVEIYGGMDCINFTWTAAERSLMAVCEPGLNGCANNITVPLTIDNAEVRLERFDIFAPNAIIAGESSIGVIAQFANLEIVDSSVTAGNGAAGAAGSNGMAGANGGNGVAGVGYMPLAIGAFSAGGVSTCGAGGGRGGGINLNDNVNPGLPAAGQPNQNNAGANATTPQVCVSGTAATTVGVNGSAGANGTGLGQISLSGYQGAAGQAGANGTSGAGGGGGGRLRVSGDPIVVVGGSGGAGGCGGMGATGGGAGGASFAIVSSSSAVSLVGSALSTGSAGAGGVGAIGGNGGMQGIGGAAGGWVLQGGGGNGYTGCAGGNGTPGGAGGASGAGAGGHSAGIAFFGNAPTLMNTPVTLGAAGVGPGTASDGLAETTLDFN